MAWAGLSFKTARAIIVCLQGVCLLVFGVDMTEFNFTGMVRISNEVILEIDMFIPLIHWSVFGGFCWMSSSTQLDIRTQWSYIFH